MLIMLCVDGKTGLPPHVPPDTSITFDLTLLGFRPRPIWVKPLIQDQNTNEKPYMVDAEKNAEIVAAGGVPFGEEFDATSGTRGESDSFTAGGRSVKTSLSMKNSINSG